ncbi:hypothetical protein BJ912DRAFT_978179 [Pholiota molesta]|nr:hypothetical protein BJ912DRAFT_978179 [Pholiota molesta]
MSSTKKAASKLAKEVCQYTPGDVVLGKMPGWPSWPGVIVDREHIPPAVRQQQPPNTTLHCIRCFPMGD